MYIYIHLSYMCFADFLGIFNDFLHPKNGDTRFQRVSGPKSRRGSLGSTRLALQSLLPRCYPGLVILCYIAQILNCAHACVHALPRCCSVLGEGCCRSRLVARMLDKWSCVHVRQQARKSSAIKLHTVQELYHYAKILFLADAYKLRSVEKTFPRSGA